ncbi:unnamed protein product, partial [Phaeothamnion confervicola]
MDSCCDLEQPPFLPLAKRQKGGSGDFVSLPKREQGKRRPRLHGAARGAELYLKVGGGRQAAGAVAAISFSGSSGVYGLFGQEMPNWREKRRGQLPRDQAGIMGAEN